MIHPLSSMFLNFQNIYNMDSDTFSLDYGIAVILQTCCGGGGKECAKFSVGFGENISQIRS